MGRGKKDSLFGTLDLLVLRALAAGDVLHGYEITSRITSASADVLKMEEGSLYPALHRMEESGGLKVEVGCIPEPPTRAVLRH